MVIFKKRLHAKTSQQDMFKKRLNAKTSQQEELSNFVKYLKRNGFLLENIKNNDLIDNYYKEKRKFTQPKTVITTEDKSEPDITTEDQSEPYIATEDQRREQPEEPTEEQRRVMNNTLKIWERERHTPRQQTSMTEVTQEHKQKATKLDLEKKIEFLKNELNKRIINFTNLQINNKIILNYTGNNENIKALIENIKAHIEKFNKVNKAKSVPDTLVEQLGTLETLETINSEMTKSLLDLNHLFNQIKEQPPIEGGKPTKYKSTGITVFILYKNKKYNRTIYIKEKGKTKYCKIKNEYILLSKLKVIG